MKIVNTAPADKIVAVLPTVKTKVQKCAASAACKLAEISGEGATEHTGWIAVALIIIGIAVAVLSPWGRNTVIPAIQDKVMGFINYSG